MVQAKPPLVHLGLVDADDVDLLKAIAEKFAITFGKDEGLAWQTVGDLYQALCDKVATEGKASDHVWPDLCTLIGNFIGVFPARITKDTLFFEQPKPLGWRRPIVLIVLVLIVSGLVGYWRSRS